MGVLICVVGWLFVGFLNEVKVRVVKILVFDWFC